MGQAPVSNNSHNSNNILPPEMLLHIFCYLPVHDLLANSDLVCNFWHKQLASNNQTTWQALLLRDFTQKQTTNYCIEYKKNCASRNEQFWATCAAILAGNYVHQVSKKQQFFLTLSSTRQFEIRLEEKSEPHGRRGLQYKRTSSWFGNATMVAQSVLKFVISKETHYYYPSEGEYRRTVYREYNIIANSKNAMLDLDFLDTAPQQQTKKQQQLQVSQLYFIGHIKWNEVDSACPRICINDETVHATLQKS